MPAAPSPVNSALLRLLGRPAPTLSGFVRIHGFKEIQLNLDTFHHPGPTPDTTDLRIATRLLAGLDESLLGFYRSHDGARILATKSGNSCLLEIFPIRDWQPETKRVQAWLNSMPRAQQLAGLATFVAWAGEPESADRLVLLASGRHRGQLWFLSHESPRKPRVWKNSESFFRELEADALGLLQNRLGSATALPRAWRSQDFHPHKIAIPEGPDLSQESAPRLTPRNQEYSIPLPEGWIPEEVTSSVVMVRRATEHFGSRLFLDRSLPHLPWDSPQAALDRWIASFQSLLPVPPTRSAPQTLTLAGKPAWLRELRGVLGADRVGRKTRVVGKAIALPHGEGGLLAVAPEVPSKKADGQFGETFDLLEKTAWSQPRPRPWSSPEALASLPDAASEGDLRGVQNLLLAGANPDAMDRAGVPALIRAIESGHLAIAKELLHAGADPEAAARDTGQCALGVAVKASRRDLVQCLLDHGAHGSGTRSNPSPVNLAIRSLLEASNDSPAIAKLLHTQGARLDPNRSSDAQLLGTLLELRPRLRGPRRKLCEQILAWFATPS